MEFFSPIFTALENIQESENAESSKKAFIFQQTLKNGQFIVAMTVVHEIFALAEPLSVALQAKYVDLASAMEMTDNLSLLLKNMRENSETKFQELFIIARKLTEEIGEEIKTPRIANRQTHRENYQCNSPEEYYRIAVFIPFIDHFISKLDQRFLKHKLVLSKIQNIIPNMIVNLNETEIKETVEVISMQWPNMLTTSNIICKNEVLLWQQKWIDVDEKPRTFFDALQLCNEVLFSNTYAILKIGATLPVTVSSVERSFSTLKRIINYLRNSTGESRLNGLALLSIHREVPIKIEEVIDRFAQKNRRMAL